MRSKDLKLITERRKCNCADPFSCVPIAHNETDIWILDTQSTMTVTT